MTAIRSVSPYQANAASIRLTAGADTQPGDVIIAVTAYSGSYPPDDSGWTQKAVVSIPGTPFGNAFTYWREAQAGDAGRTFTFTQSGGSSNVAGLLVVIKDPLIDGDPFAAFGSSSGVGSPAVVPSVVGARGGILIGLWLSSVFVAAWGSTPAGMTLLANLNQQYDPGGSGSFSAYPNLYAATQTMGQGATGARNLSDSSGGNWTALALLVASTVPDSVGVLEG